ncbi:SDR family NAD(P)-dependent oxidoreductase [Amycolatopsis taiwanensis]|uniref:3-oxoacyl-ACP reductase n=1 Tax=Amycolatopsis taiwanensis TaxID=342230 RepID=A0A9W6VEG5_9PSEU|nr:SDR family oxidoreductase [Amycolatopsis taiwanensis]GLY63471.1 3-oxoacyl-ACP reductase [Amycolatopsis taiwanensis]
MRPLEGRTALVTGGSRGIGAAIAVRLAEDGANVAITYEKSRERAEEVVARIEGLGRKALAIQADSADAAAVTSAVDRTAETLDGLDILVNNAGVFPTGSIGEIGLEDIDRALAVNLRAVIVGVRAAAKHLPDGGRIITIGSTLSERVPRAGMSIYAATKSALSGLTKGIARDLGARGVTAVLVQPGPTDTDMNPANGPRAAAVRAMNALDRHADPADIAATVAHVAGPAGRFITGSAITVDGGSNA